MISTKDFTLLITGSDDNDIAAEMLAGSGRTVIHQKLCYTPMYQDFMELKKLQLKLRSSAAAMGRKVCAVLDISEWIGHEKEDYFTIMLKYLHDKRDRMSYVFTVGKADEKQAMDIFFRLRCFLSGTMKKDETLLDGAALTEYLEGQCVERDAAGVLSELLMKEEMKQMRSLPVINSICREMRISSRTGRVSLLTVRKYLEGSQNIVSLISEEICAEYACICADMDGCKEKKTA